MILAENLAGLLILLVVVGVILRSHGESIPVNSACRVRIFLSSLWTLTTIIGGFLTYHALTHTQVVTWTPGGAWWSVKTTTSYPPALSFIGFWITAFLLDRRLNGGAWFHLSRKIQISFRF